MPRFKLSRPVTRLLSSKYLLLGYFVFFLGLLVVIKNASSLLKFQLLTGAVIIYLMLAYMHHLVDKTLTFEVVIEYILLAALVIIILQSFLI